MEAQLGLIGGTMGLLTGFSILSGVEIVYFVLRLSLNFFDHLLLLSFLRFFMSLKIPRAAQMVATDTSASIIVFEC